MTGEFSTYECEELMECGEPCVRLVGHRDRHECEVDRVMRSGRKFLAARTDDDLIFPVEAREVWRFEDKEEE